ncbi:MAG: tetratricopeptide repeat protein [candidate division WOR-3 bacterium]
MSFLALVASYFSLADSRALSSGNAWPRASEDYYFSGVSWSAYGGIPLTSDLGAGFRGGSSMSLRIYDVLFRASVLKGVAELGGDEAMEMSAAYPILDSVILSGSLQTSYSYGQSAYVPGFSLRTMAYWIGPSGDVGVGINLARLEALSVIAEMNSSPINNLSWGFSYSGGMKRSDVAVSVRMGKAWGFSLSGGGMWLTDSNKILVWPGFGLDHNSNGAAWNLSARYAEFYGQYRLLVDFGIAFKREYMKRDTGAPAVFIPPPDTASKEVASAPSNGGTKPSGKTDTKTTKPKDGGSASSGTGPKASPEEIEVLYLKGVEAYRWEDFATAIYYWERVLELDPNHEKAKRGIERAKKYLSK